MMGHGRTLVIRQMCPLSEDGRNERDDLDKPLSVDHITFR